MVVCFRVSTAHACCIAAAMEPDVRWGYIALSAKFGVSLLESQEKALLLARGNRVLKA